MTADLAGPLGSDSNAVLGDPTEEDLAELLALVRGEGRWRWLGPGVTTHPQVVGDANQQRMHGAMLTLEARGLVRRHHVERQGSVTWAPNCANHARR